MASHFSSNPNTFFFGSPPFDEFYHPLPELCLGFHLVWAFCTFSWFINTWRHRHFQINNLQWILTLVPCTKALQLGMSFVFWSSCVNFQICSLWMSFGVYVMGIFFQTISIVSFLLISHGYCIMYERLSLSERRITAALGCVVYLSLIGYRAAVPYFTVFLLVNYAIAFYVIFHHISNNLDILREQLNFIEGEDNLTMHDVLNKKYNMLKKFQGAMQIVVLSEILVNLNVNDTPDNYSFRLLVREWAQICIFLYIGWTFRMQRALHFSVMPSLKTKWKTAVPPLYSIEMDANMFKGFASKEWNVGVPTCVPSTRSGSSLNSLLVIVQHPGAVCSNSTEVTAGPKISAGKVEAVNVSYRHDETEV